MDNYKTIEQKLQTLTPFKGNSLSGYWDGEVFRVFSYSTLIAVTQPSGRVIASKKYSTTTSRHQNLIRRAWGIA
jgi:hypothetical protein